MDELWVGWQLRLVAILTELPLCSDLFENGADIHYVCDSGGLCLAPLGRITPLEHRSCRIECDTLRWGRVGVRDFRALDDSESADGLHTINVGCFSPGTLPNVGLSPSLGQLGPDMV